MSRAPLSSVLFPYTTLFRSKQEHEGYEFCHKQMAECDRQLKQYLQQREDRSQGAPLPEEKRKGRLKKKRANRSEEHTSELQSRGHLVCRLLLEKKNNH